MVKVLIADKMSPEAAKIFERRGVTVDTKTGLSADELIKIIGEYDGLAVRSTTKVNTAIIEAAKNLKVIGRAGIGVDTVDVNAATQKGIVVMNTPFGNSVTTAEHAIALLMSLARMVPQANASTHAGKWEKSKFTGMEITGKTLGIVGCGNIGSIVASRAIGLKMKVLAYDPFLTPDRAKEIGVEKCELDEMLPRCDFVTLHTPLTEKTRNILSAERLALMKKGARLINCARGGLVDETALKTALESGALAGAALDVYMNEPATDHPIFGMENAICTPHLGASTAEAQETVALQIAEQMSDFLLTGAVSNAVNMPSVTAAEAPVLKPYVKLAELLGAFVGQLAGGDAFAETEILYDGAVAELNTKPLTAAAVAGLLRPFVGNVNMVNGPVLLKEKGVKLAEVKRDRSGAFHGYIQIKLVAGSGTHIVAGTVFSDSQPRILRINDVQMEAEFGENMLFTRNADKPGYVGSLGALLGDSGVNIANFRLGRTEKDGTAVALIHVDAPAGKAVLEKVMQIPHVISATEVTLVP